MQQVHITPAMLAREADRLNAMARRASAEGDPKQAKRWARLSARCARRANVQ